MNKQEVTPENIKSLYLGDSFDDHSLIELVDYHNTTQGSVLAPGTMKNYHTTKRYLERFLKERFKSSDVYLIQVNYKFITDFEYFLRNKRDQVFSIVFLHSNSYKVIDRFPER